MISSIKKEILDQKKSLFGYLIGSLLLIWLYILIFPSIQESADQLQVAFEAYPEEFLAAFDIEDLSFDTLEKYLGAEHFSFVWPILAIVLALSRAGNYIAGEIDKRTMGLSLALPLSRAKVFFTKYLAGILSIVIFSLVSISGIIPLGWLHGLDVNLSIIVNLTILGFFFTAALFSAGIMISSFVSEKPKVYFPMTAALLAMYVTDIIANIEPSLEWLQYASIFHYFNAQDVVSNNEVSLLSYGVFFGIIVVCTSLGLHRFTKRDISV